MAQNLYADKVFSRHPSALWSLDELLSSATPLAIPTDIALPVSPALYAYSTASYGSSEFDGYYIGSDTTAANLAAQNAGVPMVYGSNDVTTITPVTGSPGSPSIIIPGFGFLNENGKYKPITVEMWLRVISLSNYPRKIFGSIASDDGLYVNGPLLSLRVGDNIGSHSVGEWERPMLIHVGTTETSAFVMINGEQVITLSIDQSIIPFATKYSFDDKDQDWLGFYAHSNVPLINVDCVSIFPYRVSPEEAKIRFVWGQSVESPEVGGTKETSLPVVMDYTFSNYANNYSFPEKSNWQNGVLNNMESLRSTVTTPNYSLPQIAFKDSGRSLQDWYDFQETLNTPTTSLSTGNIIDNGIFYKLNDSVWGVPTYISFANLNIISETIDSIYCVMEYSFLPTSAEQIIFKITNPIGEYFSCVFNHVGSTIQYRFVSNGVTTTIDGPNVTVNEIFAAGINIPTLLLNPSATNQMVAFFSNRSSLSLSIGGQIGFENGSTAKIYKVGFSNAKNHDAIKTAFTDGIVSGESFESQPGDDADILLSHFASYTLVGLYTYNSFSLDIATYSYWEDYVPLNLLGKNVIAEDGTQEYSLDYIQFNVDYPSSIFVSGGNISTESEYLKSYVYFTDMSVPVQTTSELTRVAVGLSSTKVVQPGTNWSTRIYEVVDNSIIYMPTDSDFTEMGINIQFEMKTPGIIRNKLFIRNVQLASQALNKATKTSIGSKLGRTLNPYKIVSGETVYDNSVNPFAVYKSRTPYLYLTKTSGIQLFGSTFDGTRGVEMPLNESAKRFFLTDIIQFGMYYDKEFPTEPTEILRIAVNNIDRYVVVADGVGTGKKAIVYIKDAVTNAVFYNVELFINGKADPAPSDLDAMPYLEYNNWNFVTIKFNPLINLSETTAAIRITGPFLINNLANYQVSEEEFANKFTPSLWSEINDREGNADPETWAETVSDVYENPEIENNATWQDIYASAEVRDLGLSGEEVFRSYFGSNRISPVETNIPLEFFKYQYSAFINIGGINTKGGVANQNQTVPRLIV